MNLFQRSDTTIVSVQFENATFRCKMNCNYICSTELEVQSINSFARIKNIFLTKNQKIKNHFRIQ